MGYLITNAFWDNRLPKVHVGYQTSQDRMTGTGTKQPPE